jgi:hypothetical protein
MGYYNQQQQQGLIILLQSRYKEVFSNGWMKRLRVKLATTAA